LLDLDDMMTASGRKDEPAPKGRVLDFSQVKVEDLSARKNLRSNFDLIFNEDMEKSDTGILSLLSVFEEA
jgi:hypothetical protein